MTAPKVPVWTWRDAIRKASVPPLTKHVCNMIANYISDVGSGCYPGVKALMDDTGLSNTTLAKHIKIAQEAGLLEVKRTTAKSGRFQYSHYYPRFPSNVELPRSSEDGPHNHVSELHTAKPSEVASLGGEKKKRARVKNVHTARPSETASRGPREPDGTNRVKLPCEPDAPINYPIKHSNKNTPTRSRAKSDCSVLEVKRSAPRGPVKISDVPVPELRAALEKFEAARLKRETAEAQS